MPTRIFLVLLTMVSIGCSTLTVKRIKTNPTPPESLENVGGLPFYVKKGLCLEQEVSVVPYYSLKLSTLKDGKPVVAESANISTETFASDASKKFDCGTDKQVNNPFTSLVHEIREASPSYHIAIKNLRCLQQLDNDSGLRLCISTLDTARCAKTVISKSSTPKVFVDYDTTYTVNAKSPIQGSATVSYKLNEDGSLSESSASVTNETLSTALSALPISDLIKSAAGIDANFIPEKVSLQLALERRFLKITSNQMREFTLSCAKPGNAIGSLQIQIQDVAADEKKVEKEDDHSIDVSGTIKLPKKDK